MTWEWDCRSTPHRWALTIGAWNAVVQRSDGPRYQWHAAIEHTTEPYYRHDGPTYKDAIVARAWCLTKIAELRGK